jgi:hypothetical protein
VFDGHYRVNLTGATYVDKQSSTSKAREGKLGKKTFDKHITPRKTSADYNAGVADYVIEVAGSISRSSVPDQVRRFGAKFLRRCEHGDRRT